MSFITEKFAPSADLALPGESVEVIFKKELVMNPATRLGSLGGKVIIESAKFAYRLDGMQEPVPAARKGSLEREIRSFIVEKYHPDNEDFAIMEG